MKKIFPFLIALPFTLFFVVYVYQLNKSRGEYWHAGMSDPSFLYLGSALNIASGHFPTHVDNPGAPVQAIGAICFRITHIIAGQGDFAEDVLSRTVFYLEVYNFILVSLVAMSIFIVGVWGFQISKNYIITFLIQISPFFTLSNFYGLLRISPESFLMVLGLFWLLILIKILYVHQETIYSKKYVLLLAVFSGLGVATKLNFLPLCIFPLFILKSLKNKIQYVCISIFSFVVIAFFQLFSSDKLFLWTRDLFFQSGIYATGKRNVIDVNTFFPNLLLILEREVLLSLSLVLLIFFFLFLYTQKSKNQFFIKVTGGIISVLALHIMMVAKHYHHHYLLPSMFVAMGGIITIIFFSDKFINSKWSILLGVCFISIITFNIINTKTNNYHYDYHKIENFISKRPQSLLITSYESSSVPYALSFGFYSFLAGKYQTPFDNILAKRYPNHIFYHNQKYIQWGRIVNIDSVLSQNKDFCLQGTQITNQIIFEKYKIQDSLIMNQEKVYFFSKSQ